MNDIQIFKNPSFGELRAISVNGDAYVLGKDIASALGYTNTQKAIRDHVDNDDKLTERIVLSGQNRDAVFINESGLYSLILSSKLPDAKKFKHWVTGEVLPSIRKHGGYIAGQNDMTDAELMARAVLMAQKTIEERDNRIRQLSEQAEVMRPKVLFADSVAASNTSILVGELAKIIKQNGVDMGQKRLFEWMRDNGYLIKRKGTDYNMPTQKAMEMGLFQIKETVVTHSSGYTSVNKTPKVTGKGQQFFINKFLGNQ